MTFTAFNLTTMIVQQPYFNGSIFKLKNKRISIWKQNRGDYAINLKILSKDLSVRSIHEVHKGCIVETSLVLSEEAAVCVAKGLFDQLIKDGVITLNESKNS